MSLHWCANYIGLPYHKENFHCWEAVRKIQREQFERELPFIANPETAIGQAHLYKNHPELLRWREVEDPVEGDVAQLRCSRHPRHIGVYVTDPIAGARILHCLEGNGCVAQSVSDLLAHGWKIEGYYRFKG